MEGWDIQRGCFGRSSSVRDGWDVHDKLMEGPCIRLDMWTYLEPGMEREGGLGCPTFPSRNVHRLGASTWTSLGCDRGRPNIRRDLRTSQTGCMGKWSLHQSLVEWDAVQCVICGHPRRGCQHIWSVHISHVDRDAVHAGCLDCPSS
jgi:hypothetical protein